MGNRDREDSVSRPVLAKSSKYQSQPIKAGHGGEGLSSQLWEG
jgi:hypothetical protein